jgi:hypothetical protein
LAVREDCRHYLQRTMAGGDVMRRCRLNASLGPPFDCPDGCLFFESRPLSTVGWSKGSDQPMSNTALGLAGLPPATRPAPAAGKGKSKSKKKGRKGR